MPSHRKFIMFVEMHVNVPSHKVHSLSEPSYKAAPSLNVPFLKASLKPSLPGRNIVGVCAFTHLGALRVSVGRHLNVSSTNV